MKENPPRKVSKKGFQDESSTDTRDSASGTTVTKSFQCKLEEWEAFDANLDKNNGSHPARFIRKFMRDYNNGEHIQLNPAIEGLKEALLEFAKEIKVTSLQGALDRILWDWMEERSKTRK